MLTLLLSAHDGGTAWRHLLAPGEARAGFEPAGPFGLARRLGRILGIPAEAAGEFPDGFVLVDHKSFPGTERERDRRLVEEYAPQLGWYAKVLAQALKKPLKAAFIHLPIRGEMAEVGIATT